MSRMFTDPVRHALNGATMGTRWQATFHACATFDPVAARAALQAAVDEVDAQMSTWKPDSDLMRLNAAPLNRWIKVPDRLFEVLRLGLEIGHASAGAFDIGVGDAVRAWGFGGDAATPGAIRSAMTAGRVPAHQALETQDTAGLVRKTAPLSLDLNGIAKGYGVDRLAETLGDLGVQAGLVGIDGEMRALGLRPDAEPWVIAVEAPDPNRRAAHAILALQDAAVATSGDYRHWVEVQGRRLSHTIDPNRGAPLLGPPASVTVVAQNCGVADAWATALMVKGSLEGATLARRVGLSALFLDRDGDQICETRVGRVFEGSPNLNPAV